MSIHRSRTAYQDWLKINFGTTMELGDTVQRDISVFGCKQTKVIVIDFTVSFRLSWDLLTRSKIWNLNRTHRVLREEYFSSKTRWIQQVHLNCLSVRLAQIGMIKGLTSEVCRIYNWSCSHDTPGLTLFFYLSASSQLTWSPPPRLSINWARTPQMWLH